MESNKFVRKLISAIDRQIGNNMAGTLGEISSPSTRNRQNGGVSEDRRQKWGVPALLTVERWLRFHKSSSAGISNPRQEEEKKVGRRMYGQYPF